MSKILSLHLVLVLFVSVGFLQDAYNTTLYFVGSCREIYEGHLCPVIDFVRSAFVLLLTFLSTFHNALQDSFWERVNSIDMSDEEAFIV